MTTDSLFYIEKTQIGRDHLAAVAHRQRQIEAVVEGPAAPLGHRPGHVVERFAGVDAQRAAAKVVQDAFYFVQWAPAVGMNAGKQNALPQREAYDRA